MSTGYPPIPDDEPQQVVCAGEDQDGMWNCAFGRWEADEFGLDSDEPISEGERLFVNRRLYAAQAAEIERLGEMMRENAQEYLALDMHAAEALARATAAEAEVERLREIAEWFVRYAEGAPVHRGEADEILAKARAALDRKP